MASATLAASINTVVTTGWTSPTNAYGTTADGVFATATPAKSTTVNTDYGFASFGLPAGAVISSVVVTVAWKLSNATVGGTLGVQGRNNSVTDSAAETTDTASTAVTQKTFTFGTLPSAADLNTAGRVVARVRDSRLTSNTAHTGSLDFVSMTVTYTVVDAIVPASITATSTITAALRAIRGIKNALINATSYVGTQPLVPRTTLVPSTGLVPNLTDISVGDVAGAGGTKGITPATINATSAVAASIKNFVPIAPATVNATSTVTARVNKLGAIKASISATSAIAAAMRNMVPVGASINATSSVTAGLNKLGALRASISATSIMTAALRNIVPVVASINATSAVTATLNKLGAVKSTISSTSSVAATVGRIKALGSASIGATSAVSAAVAVVLRILPATINSTSTVTAAVVARRSVRAAITSTSAVTASLAHQFRLSAATITATSTIAASSPRVGHDLLVASPSTSTLAAIGGVMSTMTSAPSLGSVLVAAGVGGVLDPSVSLHPDTSLFPGSTGSSMGAAPSTSGSLTPA